MIDHIELKTRDLEASARFYAAVLAPLGYRQVVDGQAKGFASAEAAPDFFLVSGDLPDQAHYAFRAADRATVRSCWEAGRSFNSLDRAPASAPNVHPDYYAGYLRDPDGRLVEFTCHQPED
jgi:catechol 2,3-dioxygenase-like lactoylglutathione lyase family enzyme